MTNPAQGRIFLLVESVCWKDAPLNRFDDSYMAFDERGADHFHYAAQDGNIRFAVCDCSIHFCFLHFGLREWVSQSI